MVVRYLEINLKRCTLLGVIKITNYKNKNMNLKSLQNSLLTLNKEFVEYLTKEITSIMGEHGGNLIVFKETVYYILLNDDEYMDLRRISYNKEDNQIYLHILPVRGEQAIEAEYKDTLNDADVNSLWEICIALKDTPFKVQLDETIQ